MKHHLLTLTAAATITLLAGPALAQALAPKASSLEPVRPQAVAAAPKAMATAVASVTGHTPLLMKIAAAGSIIFLADGIVVNATHAQIQPPAPGFVYER